MLTIKFQLSIAECENEYNIQFEKRMLSQDEYI